MIQTVRPRGEVNTPLVLWICAAICAHFILGEGGDQIALFHDDGVALASLGARVRGMIRDKEQTFEISSTDEIERPPAPAPTEPPKPPPPAPKPPEPIASAPKPEPPKPKPPEPKKVAVVVKPVAPAKTEPPPELKVDHRVAVRQHVQPNQQDNPNARFLGDDANHVDKETVATQTSHDQDDPNPTPGASHAGPQGLVGDSDKTKIADSDQHAGDKNRAPGEKGTEFEIQHDPMPTRPQGANAVPGTAGPQPPMSGGDGRVAGAPSSQEPGSVGEISPGSAVSIDAAGNWTFNPEHVGSGAPNGSEGQGKKAGATVASTTWLGLGGKAGPGQVNLNLNERSVVASVGQDQLTREREADGARRLSEHRGSFIASSFERWRSAIENYVSSVKPGNQTALNTAHSPFATYLNGMHNRIHPIFAESFLGSLSGLSADNPMNNPKMYTRLEIVITRNGHIVKMGVVKTSGVTAFDIAALDSVQRASPFGPAPSAIISPDGRVYLHWEFHREEAIACSTLNALPFMLNVPAPAPAVDPTPTPKIPGDPPSQERGAPPPANINESREGALEVRPQGRAS
jgi:TonB family protein